MAEIDRIKKETKEQRTFRKSSTPKNLRVFLKEVKETGIPREVRVIDNNDYEIQKLDSKTLQIHVALRGVVEKLWFVPTDNLNVAYKEV